MVALMNIVTDIHYHLDTQNGQFVQSLDWKLFNMI